MFSLGVDGPWDMVSAVPSVPQDPVAFRGTSTLLAQAAASGRLGGTAAGGGGVSLAEGDQVFLPPREGVDVTLRYVPGKGDLEALPVRFAAMQVGAGEAGDREVGYSRSHAPTVTQASRS